MEQNNRQGTHHGGLIRQRNILSVAQRPQNILGAVRPQVLLDQMAGVCGRSIVAKVAPMRACFERAALGLARESRSDARGLISSGTNGKISSGESQRTGEPRAENRGRAGAL